MCVRNDSACRFGSTFFIKKTLFEYVAIDHVVAIEKLPHVETYRPICGNAYSFASKRRYSRMADTETVRHE
jgi:hypothetical protein